MKKFVVWSVLFLVALIVMSIGFVYQSNKPEVIIAEEIITPTTQVAIPELKINPPVSLAEKIGQLFIAGHWATTPLASTTDLIKKHHLGGIVIMSAPENTDDIKDWTNTWNVVSTQPLFISIDQEGGPVSRLRGENFTQTSQRDIKDLETAYSIGETRGSELNALGINMNFAPVLDTASNPDSFMYGRVFADKTISAELASAMIDGMKESSVTGVLKHFPGHDDTIDDSHLTLPTVSIERAELDTFVAPFRELIKNKQPEAIMSAHVLFPNIDTVPASLSDFFMTDYLRGELGYTGLIITDDMSMKAISDTLTSEEASIQALQSGADVILFAAEPDKAAAAITAVIAAVETGLLSEDRITESYERVISTKQIK